MCIHTDDIALEAEGGGLVTDLAAGAVAAALGAVAFPFMFARTALSQHSFIYNNC